MMATVKALGRVIRTNPAGHMHISSSWYGGRRIYMDDPWAWQKPYGFVVMHTPVLLGTYNADPTARGLVTGLMDGLLAHGKQGRTGSGHSPTTSASCMIPNAPATAAAPRCRCSRPGRRGASQVTTSTCARFSAASARTTSAP
ncbi:hypothetical protein [Novosphingobium panipatense]|uniref:hypothetical protein n=1 Tax=Novosphingobium panipatense TaxID=428991 RepID=UPI00360FDDF5